jgi:sarcosine oxidase subunit gamma
MTSWPKFAPRCFSIQREDAFVIELEAKSPCAGRLPLSLGDVRVEEASLGALWTVAPFADQQGNVSQVMKAAHGVTYPAPGQALQAGEVQAIWFGRDTALLVGANPDASLSAHAAVTDQSDAWAAVQVSGAKSVDVLARLVPVDLRRMTFPAGHTCRTLVNHMTASITRQGDDDFLILVFRSMAQTLVDELHEAMEAVAQRG